MVKSQVVNRHVYSNRCYGDRLPEAKKVTLSSISIVQLLINECVLALQVYVLATHKRADGIEVLTKRAFHMHSTTILILLDDNFPVNHEL
jgi:hypothetical protein